MKGVPWYATVLTVSVIRVILSISKCICESRHTLFYFSVKYTKYI